ncbi:MAG: BACON domain-containing protein [Roseibacillus sp.]
MKIRSAWALPFGLAVLLAIVISLKPHDDSQERNQRGQISHGGTTPRDQSRLKSKAQSVSVSHRFTKQSMQTVQEELEEVLAASTLGAPLSFELAKLPMRGEVDSRVERHGLIHLGITLQSPEGRMVVTIENEVISSGHVFFHGLSEAFRIAHDYRAGETLLSAVAVDEIICAASEATYPPQAGYPEHLTEGPTTEVAAADEAIPLLQSLPGSDYVAYLDFDGEIVNSPYWNNGETIVAQPKAVAGNADYIRALWEVVAEDFLPFDLNVTTDRSVYDAADARKRVMCITTSTKSWYPNAQGGVAYVGSFNNDRVCWDFNGNGNTISHEIGHTVSLRHDGSSNREYYLGNFGDPSWGAIMGAGFKDLVQWSKGDYVDANNQQDDVEVIATNSRWDGTSYYSIGKRSDDIGDGVSMARPLNSPNGNVSDSGKIESRQDKDYFSFETTAEGYIALSVEPLLPLEKTNLAVAIKLYDSGENLIASNSDPTSTGAELELNLPAGNYFLVVEGAGRGTWISGGFDDYGSMGEYVINGFLPTGLLSLSDYSLDASQFGETFSMEVSSVDEWTWEVASTVDWISSSASPTQSGGENREFVLEVEENFESRRVERSAEIVFRSGEVVQRFLITQEPTSGIAIEGERNFQVDAGGHLLDIRVEGPYTTTGPFNGWSWQSEVDWIGTSSDAETGGTRYYFLNVAANNTSESRTGRFIFTAEDNRTAVITVTQEGGGITVSPESLVLSSGNHTQFIAIEANGDWNWEVDSDSNNWISSSESSSQSGSKPFGINVAVNSGAYREGTITFTTAGGFSAILTVTQEGNGTPPVEEISLSSNSLSDTGSGQIASIEVTSNSDWSWQSSEDWITSAEESNQSGNTSFDFSIAANPLTSSRSGTLLFSTNNGTQALFTIDQAAGDEPVGGGISLSESSITINPWSETKVVTINTLSDWTWISSAPWITSNDSFQQEGTKPFYFTASANPTPSQRSGTITFTTTGGSSAILTVTQEGDGTPLVEEISLSSSTLSDSGSGQTTSIEVTSNSDWSWQSSEDWITSAEESNQSGSTSFDFSIAANPLTSSRSGTLLFTTTNGAQALFTIDQAAGDEPVGGGISLSESFLTINPWSETKVVTIDTLGDWTWVSSAPWISSNDTFQQEGTKPFYFSASANPTPSQRSGTITFTTAGGSSAILAVTQEGNPDAPHEKITITSVSSNGEEFFLGFVSVEGLVYLLSYSQELNGGWQTVPGHTDVAGTGEVISRTIDLDSLPNSGGKMFFRVEEVGP